MNKEQYVRGVIINIPKTLEWVYLEQVTDTRVDYCYDNEGEIYPAYSVFDHFINSGDVLVTDIFI